MARPATPLEDKRAIFARFIEAVEDGENIRQSVLTAGTSWGAIARWLGDDTNTTEEGETFGTRYARARLVSASAFADRALDVAMSASNEGAQVARLQVDTLKWRAAMANPKEYGDRKQVDTNVTVKMLPVEERDRALARLTAKATLANPLTVQQLATVEDANVQDLDTVDDAPHGTSAT